MRLFSGKRDAGNAASPNDTYLGLRRQVLELPPAMAAATAAGGPVAALLMETGYPAGVVTLVGVADGTTSLYLSNGGGTLGAGGHAEVAAATGRWLQVAGTLLSQLEPLSDPALPGVGMTQLLAVTPDGLRGALAADAELAGGAHALSPLFYAAHGVITQVRQVPGA